MCVCNFLHLTLKLQFESGWPPTDNQLQSLYMVLKCETKARNGPDRRSKARQGSRRGCIEPQRGSTWKQGIVSAKLQQVEKVQNAEKSKKRREKNAHTTHASTYHLLECVETLRHRGVWSWHDTETHRYNVFTMVPPWSTVGSWLIWVDKSLWCQYHYLLARVFC